MMVLSTRASSPLRLATIIRSNWARMPVRGGAVGRDSVPGDAGAAPVAAVPGSGLPTGPGDSAPSVIGHTLPVVRADGHVVRAPTPLPPPATLDPMAAQYIYAMRDLRRFYPPDREVLKGINLSFYPGAKIGVIGGNGSGKSSLLRIMAGQDDEFTGEARLTPGFTVGFLSQEPELDPTKDVLGNISDGVGESKQMVDRYNEVCAAFGDPDADFDKLLAEQAELQDKIDAAGAWDLERTFCLLYTSD